MIIKMDFSKYVIHYNNGIIKVYRGEEDITEMVYNNVLRDLCIYVEDLLEKQEVKLPELGVDKL